MRLTISRFRSFLEVCVGNLALEKETIYLFISYSIMHVGIARHSPFLNTAEIAISCWKSELEKQLAEQQGENLTSPVTREMDSP